MIHVVWFKRDLRVHDNSALTAAAASGAPILPLYVIEPELWRHPAMAGRHYAFLLESLNSLDAALQARGARLVVRIGEAVEVFEALRREHGLAAIHAHEETGLLWTYERDKAVRRWAKAKSVPFLEKRQHGVFRPLFTRDGWAARWEALMRAPVLPAPERLRAVAARSDEMPDAAALGLGADPCPGRQEGGRRVGVDLLGSFLETRGRSYRRAMSSPLEGAEACSRLSAHLALGCLSMRETYQAALRAEARKRAAGDQAYAASIRSFASRLHWRCHFMQKLEDEPEIERRDLHPAYRGLRPIGPDHEAITRAWAEGRTGFPFVDACMRSLNQTGWLNFRMRAMVMAFSSYHLWQDWRAPADALGRLFVDFEPGIHYPQAQMQSGTTGVNVARIYNPVKQSREQDPTGGFIRRYVPELTGLPDAFLHEPWAAPEALRLAAGVRLGETYPERLVDHEAAARRARAAVYSVRATTEFRREARSIQNRHGSRKAGLPPTEAPRKAAQAREKARGTARQTEFEF